MSEITENRKRVVQVFTGLTKQFINNLLSNDVLRAELSGEIIAQLTERKDDDSMAVPDLLQMHAWLTPYEEAIKDVKLNRQFPKGKKRDILQNTQIKLFNILPLSVLGALTEDTARLNIYTYLYHFLQAAKRYRAITPENRDVVQQKGKEIEEFMQSSPLMTKLLDYVTGLQTEGNFTPEALIQDLMGKSGMLNNKIKEVLTETATSPEEIERLLQEIPKLLDLNNMKTMNPGV